MKPIILASGSAIRRQLLEAAGLTIEAVPARIDERLVEAELASRTQPLTIAETALLLAEKKASEVSGRRPGALVIGCDQMLDLEGVVLHKAEDREAAKQKLQRLRGRTHHLRSGMALVFDGQTIWRHNAAGKLTMRDFSDAFLDQYLDRAGDAVTRSVGAYELEGTGVQLFESIEGDYFTILGLPLLPLLDALRRQGVIAE